MGVIQIHNPVLEKMWNDSFARGVVKGRSEGVAKGVSKGQSEALRSMLQSKFGKLPKWADQRLDESTASQVTRWLKKVLAAETLEGVIGKPAAQ